MFGQSHNQTRFDVYKNSANTYSLAVHVVSDLGTVEPLIRRPELVASRVYRFQPTTIGL